MSAKHKATNMPRHMIRVLAYRSNAGMSFDCSGAAIVAASGGFVVWSGFMWVFWFFFLRFLCEVVLS